METFTHGSGRAWGCDSPAPLTYRVNWPEYGGTESGHFFTPVWVKCRPPLGVGVEEILRLRTLGRRTPLRGFREAQPLLRVPSKSCSALDSSHESNSEKSPRRSRPLDPRLRLGGQPRPPPANCRARWPPRANRRASRFCRGSDLLDRSQCSGTGPWPSHLGRAFAAV